MVSVFVPSELRVLETLALAPVPTATRMITEATPISTPSMVSADRVLLAVTPRQANRATSVTFTRRRP